MLSRLLSRFTKDLGVDLGTSNTRIYTREKGIVVNEPSIVAVNTRNEQIIAVGKEAQKMVGKTPPHISTIHPLVDGVISDFEVTEKMLKFFIDKIHQESFNVLPRPRVVIGIPLDVTEVERKAVEDASVSAGAREVILAHSIIASAIGTRLPIKDAGAQMIINLGGGRTEIAVLSLAGVVTWKSLRLAGEELNNDIIQFVRNEFNVLIGERAAEETKIKVGSAWELPQPLEMKIRGRDLISGLPKEILVNDFQIREALSRSIRLIIDNVKATLEVTPPELVADIYERGMVICGGGALLRGLDQAISKTVQFPVQIADDPLTCVVRGTGIIIEKFDEYKDMIVPSAQT